MTRHVAIAVADPLHHTAAHVDESKRRAVFAATANRRESLATMNAAEELVLGHQRILLHQDIFAGCGWLISPGIDAAGRAACCKLPLDL